MWSFISVVVPMTITKEKVSYLNGRSDWTHSVNRLRHRPNLYFTCCIGRLYTVIFGMKVGRLVAGQYAGRRFYKEAHVAKSRNANPLCASVFFIMSHFRKMDVEHVVSSSSSSSLANPSKRLGCQERVW